MQSRFLLLFCLASSLAACSDRSFSSASAAKSHSDKSVHYEAVNEQGAFVAHEQFEDDSADHEAGLQKLAVPSEVKSLVNPDTRNRVALVFVGDGYTVQELTQYNKDVANIRSLLNTQEPFKTYQNYFSMFSVQTISSRSGIDGDPSSRLGMRYNCNGFDRLLCINSTAAMVEAKLAPKVDLVFALANSEKYGGAGYRSPAISTLAARNPSAVDLAVHEMAHSFADLADEYEDAGTGTGCSAKPNVSLVNEAQMLTQKAKWFRWLDLKNIGTFAGACYNSKMYRPSLNSKMRTLGQPFEEVNLEQLILSIYKKVQPIEFATQPGTFSATAKIQVVPMQPIGQKLSIEWYLNDQLQKSLNDMGTIDASKLVLKNGTNVLKVKVSDKTLAVRDEEARAQWMTQTLQWNIKK